MEPHPHPITKNEPKPSDKFGTVPNASDEFRTAPHDSEPFRTVPQRSESFRTIPRPSERTQNHILSVREAARMFETAGVSRTERSIVKWCVPNKHDVARLDAFFDSNERKWFITPESVNRAIAEEQARAARHNESIPNHSEPQKSQPDISASTGGKAGKESDSGDKELRMQLRDLEITNRVKDLHIDRLNKELELADEERKGYIKQLIASSHQIGALETQVRLLAAPDTERGRCFERSCSKFDTSSVQRMIASFSGSPPNCQLAWGRFRIIPMEPNFPVPAKPYSFWQQRNTELILLAGRIEPLKLGMVGQMDSKEKLNQLVLQTLSLRHGTVKIPLRLLLTGMKIHRDSHARELRNLVVADFEQRNSAGVREIVVSNSN